MYQSPVEGLLVRLSDTVQTSFQYLQKRKSEYHFTYLGTFFQHYNLGSTP